MQRLLTLSTVRLLSTKYYTKVFSNSPHSNHTHIYTPPPTYSILGCQIKICPRKRPTRAHQPTYLPTCKIHPPLPKDVYYVPPTVPALLLRVGPILPPRPKISHPTWPAHAPHKSPNTTNYLLRLFYCSQKYQEVYYEVC